MVIPDRGPAIGMRSPTTVLWAQLANDDVVVRALDDRPQLGLLGRGNLELVERLLEIVQERLPLLRRDVEVAMRLRHAAPGVALRATRGPAHHFGDQVLEA